MLIVKVLKMYKLPAFALAATQPIRSDCKEWMLLKPANATKFQRYVPPNVFEQLLKREK